MEQSGGGNKGLAAQRIGSPVEAHHFDAPVDPQNIAIAHAHDPVHGRHGHERQSVAEKCAPVTEHPGGYGGGL